MVHDYTKGWQDGSIYGEATPGWWEWLRVIAPHYDVVIFSSRVKTSADILDVTEWLEKQWQKWCTANSIIAPMPMLRLVTIKPPAWVTIDDRAIRFDGSWSDKALTLKGLQEFKPWMHRPGPTSGK